MLGGAQNVRHVWILPTNTAKYVSPLDNNLWHSLKQRVRARKPRTELGTAKIIKESSWVLVKRTFKVILEIADLHRDQIQVRIFRKKGKCLHTDFVTLFLSCCK